LVFWRCDFGHSHQITLAFFSLYILDFAFLVNVLNGDFFSRDFDMDISTTEGIEKPPTYFVNILSLFTFFFLLFLGWWL
jgi:hypothetical protein